MSESLRQIGYAMRLGVVVFVAPVMILATGFFIWEEMYLYAAAMMLFLFLIGLGVYMNFRRLLSDERIDDERIKQINRRSGFNAFWIVVNASILLEIFREVVAALLNVQKVFLMKYDLTIILAVGFASYICFRTYYLRYGVESGIGLSVLRPE